MRNAVVWILRGLLFMFSLTGCSGQADQSASSGPKPISDDMLGQDLHDALRHEWETFDSLSSEQKIHLGRLPGVCFQNFTDWAACEDFWGITIPNPLEEAPWLDKGTYVGMPEDFLDALHVQASWFGTREGHVEWLSIQSGYQDDGISVVLYAMLYGDSAEGKSADSGWSTELARQSYLANSDDSSVLLTEDSSEQYTARTAYLVQDYVLYRVRVVGETHQLAGIQEALADALAAFDAD